jgi:hypothetical protein
MKSGWSGRLIFLFLCFWFVAFGIYWFWPETVIRHDPGILVKEEPVQKPTSVHGWEKGDYRITPLAEFEAKALILHLKKYGSGRESDLSPIDLALGWGPMSDQSVIDRLEISQSGRWYEYKARVLPIPQKVISASSSNMHMIPADEEVEDVLDDLHRGDIVWFSGYLVEAKSSDGWGWRSSLSRTDEGNGACEIVWVRDVKRIDY